jgi:exosortase H (IPTLxxWG-CTERM-specific)
VFIRVHTWPQVLFLYNDLFMPVPDPKAQMRRFLALFPILLIVGFGLLQVPAVDAAVAKFTHALVNISGGLIHVCGGNALVSGNLLSNPVRGEGVVVENGCNAVNVTILLWAAILTYPARWRHKLKGLAIGSLALHAVNLLRIVSLFYLQQYNQQWFDFAHFYLWESLIVLDTLVIFWVWAVFARRAGGLDASAA